MQIRKYRPPFIRFNKRKRKKNMKNQVKKVVVNRDLVNSLVDGVVEFMNKRPDMEWSGTMTTLQSRLRRIVGKSLPASPSYLRVVLNQAVNKLRARGIATKFSRSTDHSRTRIVSLIVK